MIDWTQESLVPLPDAGAHFPSHPHRNTLARWARSGVRGALLETMVIGSRRYTTREAINRFIALLNARHDLGEIGDDCDQSSMTTSTAA
jgi:hypothetical protein